MHKIFLILSICCLTGCSGYLGDQERKRVYSNKYAQNSVYVKAFEESIRDTSLSELVEKAAQAEKRKMKGQKRLQLDRYLYIEDVTTQDNAVVFHYSFTHLGNNKSQQIAQKKMQKDLIFRTCSLQTVRIAQEKGLKEIHYYYDQYPEHIAFTLYANKSLCESYGFY